MNKLFLKRLVLAVCLLDILIAGLLLKSRLFSHLAIWNITESGDKRDFDWPPGEAPRYFRFEPYSDELASFKDEATAVIQGEEDEFKIALKMAKRIISLNSSAFSRGLSVQWDSPQGMLRQMKKGAFGDCFHRSILLSTYLSSVGIKSRVWALENKMFNGTPHSINEVYVKSLRKWVFMDTMWGFYATENQNGIPLSFLELREGLLNPDKGHFLVRRIKDDGRGDDIGGGMLTVYRRLVACAFLRADNDFVKKYDLRYGHLSFLKSFLDKLPRKIKKGLAYFFGGHNLFIHYTDQFSPSLRLKIAAAKSIFYLFIVSSAGLVVFLAFVSFRKIFAANLSRKDTRQT